MNPPQLVSRIRSIPTCVGTTERLLLYPHPVLRSIPTCVGTTLRPDGVPNVSAVHPHVRGDYSHHLGPDKHESRSIPTCVGTTLRLSPGSGGAEEAVHPHVRGDYAYSSLGPRWSVGPSPRAWGLRGRGPYRPARPPVHPHVRGDYADMPGLVFWLVGPSPRAWGLLTAWTAFAKATRSIPTCVGTTTTPGLGYGISPVHPHVRGDYAPGLWHPPSHTGPSPRAWGLRGWFITRWGATPVHPHVRGDYIAGQYDGSGENGPSPRAWGLRGPGRRTRGRGSVHPHVRGDYGSSLIISGSLFGPSPRAWGLRHHERPKVYRSRSIPTCVGTTQLLLEALEVLVRSIPTCVGTTPSSATRASSSSVHPHVRGDYT